MAKSRSLQQAVRFALATATAAAGVSALHAQEAPAPAAAAAPVEEVVVTGSRLSTPNETSISPITTVSAVDLQQTGLTRVEDVLNNLPMVFAGMNSTTSNGADGTASIDLRGLGNQRTLVLVDGLRLGPGSALNGRNYSDINQIPAALIERVDAAEKDVVLETYIFCNDSAGQAVSAALLRAADRAQHALAARRSLRGARPSDIAIVIVTAPR